MAKRKVAVFGIKTYPAYAGVDRVAENIVAHLEGEFECWIYLISTKQRLSGSGNKRFVYMPCLPGKHLQAFSFFLMCTIHMLFVKRYDLIHVHKSDTGLFTYALGCSRRYRNRIMGTFHGDPYRSDKWGRPARWYLRLSERLFIRSCSVLTSVSAAKTVDKKNVVFIPNGVERVNTRAFRHYANSSIDYDQLGISKGRYILFASGRLDRKKGLHHLLDAYEKERMPGQLVIISDFSHDRAYSAVIGQRLRRLGASVVVIRKLLPKADLFDVIVHARMMVFPSELEAMSMLLLEVIACNTLLVCSDIDANVRVLGTNYKYLFRNGDTASLTGAINTAARDADTGCLENYTQKREEMLCRYNWEAIAAAYGRLYRSLAEGSVVS